MDTFSLLLHIDQCIACKRYGRMETECKASGQVALVTQSTLGKYSNSPAHEGHLIASAVMAAISTSTLS